MAIQFFSALTIDHTKVGSATQTNYPCLVSLTDNRLKGTAAGGHVTSTAGFDIFPYLGTRGISPLLHRELEYYNGTTGSLCMWVLMPLVSNTIDTTFNLYYDDPTQVTDYDTAGAVWAGTAYDGTTTRTTTGYAGVYHFPDGTTLGLLDSTTNTINGTNHSAAAGAGIADGGIVLNSGSSQYADFGTNFSNKTSLTWEVWVNPGSTNIVSQVMLGKFSAIAPVKGLELNVAPSTLGAGQANEFQVLIGNAFGNPQFFNSGTALTTGSWGYCVFTYDNAIGKQYQNATLVSSITGADMIAFNGIAGGDVIDFNVGRSADNLLFLTGTIDEVRISSNVRTQDYFQTVYNNISNPATFLSLGVEQQITPQTITGKARIQAITTKTITGQANILKGIFIITAESGLGYKHAQLGYFGLGYHELSGNLTDKTITGKADIRKTTTQTITGVANINLQQNRTIAGKARIQLLTEQSLTGKANIQVNIVTKTITGVARIQLTTLQTSTGKARIQRSVTQNITGVARIQSTTSKILNGKAHIIIAFPTPTSNTFIVVPETRTFTITPDTSVFVVTPENRTFLVQSK